MVNIVFAIHWSHFQLKKYKQNSFISRSLYWDKNKPFWFQMQHGTCLDPPVSMDQNFSCYNWNKLNWRPPRICYDKQGWLTRLCPPSWPTRGKCPCPEPWLWCLFESTNGNDIALLFFDTRSSTWLAFSWFDLSVPFAWIHIDPRNRDHALDLSEHIIYIGYRLDCQIWSDEQIAIPKKLLWVDNLNERRHAFMKKIWIAFITNSVYKSW